MRDSEHCIPTKYYFGSNNTQQALRTITRDIERILVVTGSLVFSKYAFNDTLDSLPINYRLLDGVKAEPDSAKVYEGIDLCREFAPQLILAFGGGSVVDTAKAISIGASNISCDFFEFFTRQSQPQSAIPICVILTRYGSGSESSDGAVISHQGRKLSCGSPLLRPSFAIIDCCYFASLSHLDISRACFDMFSHVCERYFSNTADVLISSALCESLMRVIVDLSLTICQSASVSNLDHLNLAYASKIAHDNSISIGRQQDWATHTIAHEVGELLKIPHADSLSIILPYWMEHVCTHNPPLFTRFCREVFSLAPDVASPLEASRAVRRWASNLGLPTSLKSVNDYPGDLAQEISQRACSTTLSGTVGNFVRLTSEDIQAIIKKSLQAI